MAKVLWTKCPPGSVTTITLPSGRQVALEHGENDVPDESYAELDKLGLIESDKSITKKKKE
jgi:hypothetical protein